MSAAEVIAEIEKLPEAEQEKVLLYLAEARKGRSGKASAVHYLSAETFKAAKDLVLRENDELLRRLAK